MLNKESDSETQQEKSQAAFQKVDTHNDVVLNYFLKNLKQ